MKPDEVVALTPNQRRWQRRLQREAINPALRQARLERMRPHNAKYWVKHGRRHELKRLYKMTVDEYERMLTLQNGVCAICGKPPKNTSKLTRYLVVDHDHTNGKIRALLCRACNVKLRFVEDTKWHTAALEYLAFHQQKWVDIPSVFIRSDKVTL